MQTTIEGICLSGEDNKQAPSNTLDGACLLLVILFGCTGLKVSVSGIKDSCHYD